MSLRQAESPTSHALMNRTGTDSLSAVPVTQPRRSMETTLRAPTLRRLLAPERVLIDMPARSKEAAINGLLDCLGGHEFVRDLDRVREDVWERERLMSTGVGHALGVPHAKSPGATGHIAAFASTAAPIDFGSLGGEPVQHVFLLVGPDGSGGAHIKLLGRLARLFTRPAFRTRIESATTPQALLDAVEGAELRLFE